MEGIHMADSKEERCGYVGEDCGEEVDEKKGKRMNWENGREELSTNR